MATRRVLLRNCRQALQQRRDILIEDGKIAQIVVSPIGEEIKDVDSFDLGGLTILPGFIDVQVNGAIGVDAVVANEDDLLKVSAFLASHGAAAWLPTFIHNSDENYARAIDAITSAIKRQYEQAASSSLTGARILGVHYEGPFLNPEQHGAHRPELFRIYRNPSDLNRLKTIPLDSAVHMMTVAPEMEGGLELVKELKSRGWIVAIGHTRAGIEVLEKAHAYGARYITHLMNAMPQLHHREPGVVGWALTKNDVTCGLIADGVHVDPLVLRLVLQCKTAARILLKSDSMMPTGLGDGAFDVWGETISVSGRQTRSRTGRLAGSVITIEDAVKMMKQCGASWEELTLMASYNPASLLGINDKFGHVEVGREANLVALDEESNVKLTIIGGEVRWS